MLTRMNKKSIYLFSSKYSSKGAALMKFGQYQQLILRHNFLSLLYDFSHSINA